MRMRFAGISAVLLCAIAMQTRAVAQGANADTDRYSSHPNSDTTADSFMLASLFGSGRV